MNLSTGISDIGLKRKTNQDAIYLNDDKSIYIVADGMGGHSGGEIASALAIKYFSEFLTDKIQSQTPITNETIRNATFHANKLVKKFGDMEPTLQGMGTTLVSIIADKNKIIKICNIGDSRAYLIRDQQIFQLTKDHSLVQEKLELGLYTREQARSAPQKNALSRALGYDEILEVDVFNYEASSNDILLLCSDGLHGKISDEDMLFIIDRHLNNNLERIAMTECAAGLISQANNNGGQDNISVIIVGIK